jgi:hypothetical protein
MMIILPPGTRDLQASGGLTNPNLAARRVLTAGSSPAGADPLTLIDNPENRAGTPWRACFCDDVVDRSAADRRQIVLATNQHTLGFGASSIYVVEPDNDGIQR